MNLVSYEWFHRTCKSISLSLSLTVLQLKFIDSFQFTPEGLDVLAKTLVDDEFRYLRESCASNHFGLIWKPMASFDRFGKTKLPSQDAVFSKLSGSPCSDSEYTHAIRVWTAFGCRTMADYHDIYLQLDVLLLADFFWKVLYNLFRVLQSRSGIIIPLLVLPGMQLSGCQVLICNL